MKKILITGGCGFVGTNVSISLNKLGFKIYSLDRNLVKWTKTNNTLSSSIFQKLIDSFNVYHNYMQFNFFKSIYFTLALSINFLKKKYL